MPQVAPSQTEHASCVALAGRGLLIRGASGSGKSTLALQLMGYGADLVADDRVQLWRQGGQVMANAPDSLAGLIEARHLGILRAASQGPVPLCAIVEMDRLETERLPRRRHAALLGQDLMVFYRVEAAHFAAALLQFLKAGVMDPDV